MVRVDHVHVVQVGGGGLVGEVHRVLQRQVPDGEGFKLGVAGSNAAVIVVVKLAQAGGHFPAAGTRRGHDHQRARGFDIVVAAVAVFAHDIFHVGGIARDWIMAITANAQRRQLSAEAIRARLAGVLRDDHAADVQTRAVERVRQAQHIVVVGDAQVSAALVLFNVVRVDDDDDFHLTAKGAQHAHLAVRREAGKHARGVIVVKQLSAELEIQLPAELGNAPADAFGLKLDILVVVKTDAGHGHLSVSRLLAGIIW